MKDNLENEILGNEDLLEEDLGGVSDDDILDELFSEDDTSEEIDSNNEQEIIDNEELESIKLEEQLEKTDSLIEEEDTIIEDGTDDTTEESTDDSEVVVKTLEDTTEDDNKKEEVIETAEDINNDTEDVVEDSTNNAGTNETENVKETIETTSESIENNEEIPNRQNKNVENIEDDVVEDTENVDKDTGTKETVQEIKDDIKNSDKDIYTEEAVQDIKEDTEINEDEDTEDEESVVVTKEEKKKKSIVPVIVILILAVLGAIIAFILNNRTIVVNEDKHIKLAEEVPVVSDSSIELSKDNSGIVAPTKEFELVPMGDDEHIKSDLGEIGDKPIMASIVTKIDLGQGEKRYAGNIFIGQGKTIYGYEKIKAAIKEFNTNSTEIIKIPDKPKKDSHTDLVLVRFAVKISEDFPVEDIYNKVINIKPSFDLDIEGKLENDLYSFGLPSFTPMYKYNELKAGDTIQVGFIAFMPFDIKADKYKLKLRISDKLNEENKLNIDIKSFDTPKEK